MKKCLQKETKVTTSVLTFVFFVIFCSSSFGGANEPINIDTKSHVVKKPATSPATIWDLDFTGLSITGLPRQTIRVTTITSSATPTINTDNADAVTITALATNITSMTTNLSGTPGNFDKLIIRFKDDGNPRSITWGASFASSQATLPTTTIASKVLTVGLIWDSVQSKWICLATDQAP